MAIDPQFARFLISCKKDGVNFHSTLMLGRLNYYLSVKETKNVLQWGKIDPTSCPKLLDYDRSRYAETFFEMLGAEKVQSMDASDFEGASIVHDLNRPISDQLKERFDCVCDAGTLEHVMTFPVAIRNAMEMTKVGGHLILATPANNFFGHGFYQFSPELLFRVLSKTQGFEVRRMVAAEYRARPRWFEVADPEVIRERVAITNRCPVLLFVLARRVGNPPIFETIPQQSDYVPRWEGKAGDAASTRTPLEVRLRRGFLETWPALARFLEVYSWSSWWNRKHSFRNRRFFKRVQR